MIEKFQNCADRWCNGRCRFPQTPPDPHIPVHAAPKNAADIGILSNSSFLLRILLIMIIMVMDEAKQEYVSEMYTRRLSVY